MTDHFVERVHLVYKTHLDLGFTDLAERVYRRYLDEFIPAAIRLAKRQRDADPVHRFTWTTGSWLIEHFLEEADSAARRELEEAILIGDITWHALPFTTHSEFMDAELFRFGLSISQRLDARFGRKTIAAKMTDVPGHTRGIVPLLAEAGVEFLHLGVNQTSAVPNVPPLFVWRDDETDTSVTVMYSGEYGETRVVPGTKSALALVLTGDNVGPPSPDDLAQQYRSLEAAFPQARINASSLDGFARELRAVRAALPIITDEIGDTWIHGVGSDPTKVRRFRELRRLRRSWMAVDLAVIGEQRLRQFDDFLLCAAEHTWGLDSKLHIADNSAYAAEAFQQARLTPPFRQMERSWAEQSAYVDSALAALDGTPLREQAGAALGALEPRFPDLSGFERCDPDTLAFALPALALAFDPADGSIIHLRTNADGRAWADTMHRLAQLRFQAFDETDYARFQAQYMRNLDKPMVSWWALRDFTKPGIDGQARRETAQPQLEALFARQTEQGHEWLALLRFPAELHQMLGAPARLVAQYRAPWEQAALEVTIQWFDKPAVRLPHALWCGFTPLHEDSSAWSFTKLGSCIDPGAVVSRGARSLHAVDEMVDYRDAAGTFRLTTFDAPLIAPGRPALLEFDDALPDMRGGVHVNLYNNVWNTNFPLWFGDDALFRFKLEFSSGSEQ